MAKENYISLRGQCRSDILLAKDNNDVPTTALFSLHTVKRSIRNRSGQLDPKFDRPIIMTDNPEVVRQIVKIKKHDIVEIKGSFTTGKVIKHKKCPYCGCMNDIEVPLQVITPSYVGVLRSDLKNDAEGLKELVDAAEISNVAKVIGRVCSPDIRTGVSEIGDVYASYQLAVNRKYYLYGTSNYDDHADYPYVISYNKQAEDDEKALVSGSLVYIDGYVHTMLAPLTVECANEECQKEFTINSQRMSITPYSVEYLRDYNEDAIEESRPNRKSDDGDEVELKAVIEDIGDKEQADEEAELLNDVMGS